MNAWNASSPKLAENLQQSIRDFTNFARDKFKIQKSKNTCAQEIHDIKQLVIVLTRNMQ